MWILGVHGRSSLLPVRKEDIMRDMDLKILEELDTILPDPEPETEVTPNVETREVTKRRKAK